jgi:hypothetical protein
MSETGTAETIAPFLLQKEQSHRWGDGTPFGKWISKITAPQWQLAR